MKKIFKNNQEGAVLPLAVAFITVGLILIIFSIDIANLLIARARLQNVSDSMADAGGIEVSSEILRIAEAKKKTYITEPQTDNPLFFLTSADIRNSLLQQEVRNKVNAAAITAKKIGLKEIGLDQSIVKDEIKYDIKNNSFECSEYPDLKALIVTEISTSHKFLFTFFWNALGKPNIRVGAKSISTVNLCYKPNN